MEYIENNKIDSLPAMKTFLDHQAFIVDHSRCFSDYLYWPAFKIGELVDRDPNEATFILVMLAQFFACLYLSTMTSPAQRKIFSTTVGFCLVSYFYGSGIFLILFFNVSAYLLYRFLPRTAGAISMVVLTFFAFLSVNVYNFFTKNQLVGGHGFHVFSALSINFGKHLILAWNYYDAGLLDDPKRSKHITQRERYYAQPHRQPLSFVQWFNYFFFVGSCITPMHEYRDFEEFLEFRGPIKHMPKYGNVWPAMERFAHTLICLGVLTVVQASIDPQYMLTQSFSGRSLPFKLLYLIASMHEMIYRLYFAFGSIESNFIASGMSFTASNPPCYNSLRAVEMVDFELSLTGTDALSRWNMFTNRWLKYYVQMRLMDRTRPRNQIQIVPMVSAFVVSSIWHGIELGYAVFFGTLFLNAIAAKMIQRTQLAAQVMKAVPWEVLRVVLWLWNFFQLSYGGMAFVFLYWSRFDPMHAAFGYFLHWFYPIYVLVAVLLPKQKHAKADISASKVKRE